MLKILFAFALALLSFAAAASHGGGDSDKQLESTANIIYDRVMNSNLQQDRPFFKVATLSNIKIDKNAIRAIANHLDNVMNQLLELYPDRKAVIISRFKIIKQDIPSVENDYEVGQLLWIKTQLKELIDRKRSALADEYYRLEGSGLKIGDGLYNALIFFPLTIIENNLKTKYAEILAYVDDNGAGNKKLVSDLKKLPLEELRQRYTQKTDSIKQELLQVGLYEFTAPYDKFVAPSWENEDDIAIQKDYIARINKVFKRDNDPSMDTWNQSKTEEVCRTAYETWLNRWVIAYNILQLRHLDAEVIPTPNLLEILTDDIDSIATLNVELLEWKKRASSQSKEVLRRRIEQASQFLGIPTPEDISHMTLTQLQDQMANIRTAILGKFKLRSNIIKDKCSILLELKNKDIAYIFEIAPADATTSSADQERDIDTVRKFHVDLTNERQDHVKLIQEIATELKLPMYVEVGLESYTIGYVQNRSEEFQEMKIEFNELCDAYAKTKASIPGSSAYENAHEEAKRMGYPALVKSLRGLNDRVNKDLTIYKFYRREIKMQMKLHGGTVTQTDHDKIDILDSLVELEQRLEREIRAAEQRKLAYTQSLRDAFLAQYTLSHTHEHSAAFIDKINSLSIDQLKMLNASNSLLFNSTEVAIVAQIATILNGNEFEIRAVTYAHRDNLAKALDDIKALGTLDLVAIGKERTELVDLLKANMDESAANEESSKTSLLQLADAISKFKTNDPPADPSNGQTGSSMTDPENGPGVRAAPWAVMASVIYVVALFF